MNEQTIKINVPDGKKVVYDEKTQTIEFVDIKPIKSKSWEEFCNNHPQISYEYYLQQSVTMVIPPTTETRINFRHISHGEQSKCLLKTKEDAEGILALIQLTRLHDEWIGDWMPNYCDDKTKKWHIYFFSDEIDIAWSHEQKRFLVFPSKEMAKEFLDCFRDLIQKAKKFI